MSGQRYSFDIDHLAKLYNSGVSELQLAKRFGVDRGSIRPRLLRAGVTIRGCGEALRLRMSKLSKKQRAAITKAANEKSRGSKTSEQVMIARAKTHEKSLGYIGKGESEIFNWLTERGHKCTKQKAVNRYNIDMVVGRVAVEIVISTNNPLNLPHNRRKIEYLTKNGWAVIFIRVRDFRHIIEAHADYVSAFINSVRRNPSLLGEYRVIGRHCEVKTVMRFNP